MSSSDNTTTYFIVGIMCGTIAGMIICTFIMMIYNQIFKNDKSFEFFTQTNIDFANNLFNDLTNNKDLSYTGYLNLLSKNNNMSLNLLNEDVYQKLINNNNLQINDILSLL